MKTATLVRGAAYLVFLAAAATISTLWSMWRVSEYAAVCCLTVSLTYLVWKVKGKTHTRGADSETSRIRSDKLDASLLSIFLLSTGVISAGYLARPSPPYDVHEEDEIRMAAITAVLARYRHELQDQSIIYVRAEAVRDLLPDVWEELSSKSGSKGIARWTTRPKNSPRCADSPGVSRIGFCEEDNFISADGVSRPLWHVAVVDIRTVACGWRVTSIKLFGDWKSIAVERRFCI
jgi:hypothetical protein